MGRRRKRVEEVEYYRLSPETKRGIFIVFLFALALISILSFLNLAGRAGIYIDYGLGMTFGLGRFLFPAILIFLGYVLARPGTYQVSVPNYIGIFLFIFSVHGLLHVRIPLENSLELAKSGLGGGGLGYLVSYPVLTYLGLWAGLIVFVAIFIASILLMFNTSIERLLARTNIFNLFSPFTKRHEGETDFTEKEIEPEETKSLPDDEDDITANEVKSPAKEFLSTKQGFDEHPMIKAPKIKVDLPLDLLDDRYSEPTSGDIKLGAEKIQKTLENFNIPVEMDGIQVGPTVTQYTFKPAEGIKLSRITALNNDLALALAAHPVRIEAPIPGKSLVGIEVPNVRPSIVRVRRILESKSFRTRKSNLEISLGIDVSGRAWTSDLGGMPHLLVAGATGSGKSICLNSIIISLLYQNNPDLLRLILVDPKRVEFPIYNGIPHLLSPVITDVTKTVNALRWTISEMDRRFDVLSSVNKRNVGSYNLSSKEKMPYIVIIIDELADLMVAAAAEVEACIIRLTQMARAVGIHLVVATQRPSVDVITGLIKANIPCRAAFSVASLVDSRTILDTSGAEKLVGKGDMLYMSPQTAKPRRLQGAYVSDEEIKRVVSFLRNACEEPPEYLDEITDKPRGRTSFDFKGGGDDDLLEEAKEMVIRSKKASTSFLQRRFRIGYARAARLMDLLEEAGIVGSADGARAREVLVDDIDIFNRPAKKQTTSFSNTTAAENDEILENDSDDNEIEETEEPKKNEEREEKIEPDEIEKVEEDEILPANEETDESTEKVAENPRQRRVGKVGGDDDETF